MRFAGSVWLATIWQPFGCAAWGTWGKPGRAPSARTCVEYSAPRAGSAHPRLHTLRSLAHFSRYGLLRHGCFFTLHIMEVISIPPKTILGKSLDHMGHGHVLHSVSPEVLQMIHPLMVIWLFHGSLKCTLKTGSPTPLFGTLNYAHPYSPTNMQLS